MHPDTKAPESVRRLNEQPFDTSGRLKRYPSSGSEGSGHEGSGHLDLDSVIVEPVVLVQKGHTSEVSGRSEPKRQRTGETPNRSDSEQVVQEQSQEQEVFSGKMLQNGTWTNANLTALKTWKISDYTRSNLKTPGCTNIRKDLVFWNKFKEEIGIASSVTPQQVCDISGVSSPLIKSC